MIQGTWDLHNERTMDVKVELRERQKGIRNDMEILLMDKVERFNTKTKGEKETKVVQFAQVLMHFQVTLHETMEIPSLFLCFYGKLGNMAFDRMF